MRMKSSLIRVILLSLFFGVVAHAGEFSLEICATNHSLYRINGRQVTQNQLDVVLRKIVDSNMFIYVFCETNVSPGQISQALSSIQTAGLRYVLLACRGEQGGTNGTYLVTLDCAKYPFSGGSDSGGERWVSGFYPNRVNTPLWVDDWLEKRFNNGELGSDLHILQVK